MKYTEAAEILSSFENQHRTIWLDPEIIGISIGATKKSDIENGNFSIIIRLTSDESLIDLKLKSSKIQSTFIFEDREFEVVGKKSELPKLQIEAGVAARPLNSVPEGTYGWGFILDGEPTLLSNWHVFCEFGNDTQLGSRIEVDGQNSASLSFFEEVRDIGWNTWDLALARFDHMADLEALFRVCSEGVRRPYPTKMEFNPEIGDTYYKVGRTKPNCREGVFQHLGTTRAEDGNGVSRFYRNQLIFSKMTDAGDSGSIIVNKNSNEICGLNFAGNDEETIANPIFLKGWTYRGRYSISANCEVPEYTTSQETISSDFHSENNESIKVRPSNSNLGIPPSIFGVQRNFRVESLQKIIRETNLPDRLTVIETYGQWYRLGLIKWGHGPSARPVGWVNTSAPDFLYLG